MMRIGALFHGLGSEHGTYYIGQLVFGQVWKLKLSKDVFHLGQWSGHY